MNEQHQNNEQTPSQNLQVWYCEHCRTVHFRTQNVMLNFSKKEFVELNNAMQEIFQNNFRPVELRQLSNSLTLSDDILSSEVVS